VVVKHGGSFVKASRMRRSSETELLAIEVMRELVAKRAQECAKRGNLLAHGGAGPDANRFTPNRIISEKLGLPSSFPHAKRSSRQRTDLGNPHAVEGGGCA